MFDRYFTAGNENWSQLFHHCLFLHSLGGEYVCLMFVFSSVIIPNGLRDEVLKWRGGTRESLLEKKRKGTRNDKASYCLSLQRRRG